MRTFNVLNLGRQYMDYLYAILIFAVILLLYVNIQYQLSVISAHTVYEVDILKDKNISDVLALKSPTDTQHMFLCANTNSYGQESFCSRLIFRHIQYEKRYIFNKIYEPFSYKSYIFF